MWHDHPTDLTAMPMQAGLNARVGGYFIQRECNSHWPFAMDDPQAIADPLILLMSHAA